MGSANPFRHCEGAQRPKQSAPCHSRGSGHPVTSACLVFGSGIGFFPLERPCLKCHSEGVRPGRTTVGICLFQEGKRLLRFARNDRHVAFGPGLWRAATRIIPRFPSPAFIKGGGLRGWIVLLITCTPFPHQREGGQGDRFTTLPAPSPFDGEGAGGEAGPSLGFLHAKNPDKIPLTLALMF